MRLVVELGPQPPRLQEQSPGTHTCALSQKEAQSDCRQMLHQLVDGKLASPNKAEAACQVKSPMLGMSFPRLLFLKERLSRKNLLRRYCDKQEMGPQETTCKNKILLYEHLCTLLEACPQQTLLRNKSDGTVFLVA